MFLSAYELQAREIRKAAERRDQLLKAAEPPTPGHSAAAAAIEYARDNAEAAEAERRRARVQHEVDPCLHEAPGVPEVDLAEVGKAYRDGFEVEFPADCPPVRRMSAEEFRRAPAAAGHAADSPGSAPPARPVPVPSGTLTAAAISRPLITDGQSRPCAPGAC